MNRRKRVTTLILTAALTGLPPLSATAAAAPAVRPPSGTVTLITGDRVTLMPSATTTGVKIDPAPGRERMVFHRREANGHAIVIPDDALPALAANRLDSRLFDITDLTAQGYDDSHRPDLPLLVSKASTGLTAARTLPKLGITAAKLSKKDAPSAWPLPEGQRVWLDGKVRASLDQSVPMIGAPEVWQAGFRGAGVKVAVLDTGYDPTHPDIVVSDAKGFTEGGPADVVDRAGHGTHVTSIVAGRGAKYTGVAPDATVIMGKVLGDSGWGTDSSVLAGMEWAVDSGARVVNMSLGSTAPSDGTDILSQAVNDLTAKTGTLFVISAGNTPFDHAIGSPGAAEAALTVTSVTKAGALSGFASRGPRFGDDGIKPDIAAPGSDITAARANGTAGEGPYVTKSGTSMAAPHVAGAAALLAQRNPGWKAADLKSALVTTAKPIADRPIYDQGGGIVNVAQAMAAKVTTDVASVGFGKLNWPWNTSPAQSKNITYRNDGDTPRTVTLTTAIDAPAGLFSVTPTTLSLPAHGTAQATVTLTPSAGKDGLRGGTISSTVDGSPGPRVLLGASLEDERYELTIKTVGRDGKPAPLPNLILANKEGTFVTWPVVGPDGVVLRIPKGTYTLLGSVVDRDESFRAQATTTVAQPGFAVTAQSTVVLDARGAQPVQVQLDGDPDARQLGRSDGVGLLLPGNRSVGTATDGPTDLPYYAQPVKNPDITYYSQSTWARPRTTLTVTAPQRFEVPVEYAINSAPITDLSAGVVDAKNAQPDEIAGLDLKGKIALVREGDDSTQQVENVAGAGAVAAVFTPSRFGMWVPEGTKIPVVSAGLAFDRLASLATAARMRGYDVSPTGYHLMFPSIGEVPAGRTYRARKSDLVAVDHDYRAPGVRGPGHTLAWSTPPASGFITVQRFEATLPMRRVEYFSPGKWNQWVSIGQGDSCMMETPETTFERGKTYRSVWYQGVFAPRLDWPGFPAVSRDKDLIQAFIRMWSSPTAWSGSQNESDSGSTTLSLNGKVLQTVDQPGGGYWQGLPAESGTYELSTTAVRQNPSWQRSTEIRSSWRFSSAATTSETPLLLLDPRYDVPLDADNRGGGPFVVTVKAKTFKAFASFDGTTWKQLAAVQLGDRWLVQSPGGRSGDMVSLRVTAESGDRSVDQTLINAYQNR